LTHVNVYIGATVETGANGAFVCVWNGLTLVAYAAISSPGANAWTGELALTCVDCTFTDGDDLYIGIAFDGYEVSGHTFSIGYDAGGSTQGLAKYDDVTVGATPPNVGAWTNASTAHDLGVVLRYTVP
jgi:hypothetical protein